MDFSFVNHQIGIIVFLFACLSILITNFMVLRRLGSKPEEAIADPDSMPFISILVPARNEEASIEECVVSLLKQDYPKLEIIVLNDHSTDNTGTILNKLAMTSTKIKIVEGKELPPGWIGKNWACHQLAEISHGTLLLFTDADTRHEPNAIREAVQALSAHRYDFLSAFPHQIVDTFGEKLLVPTLYWYTQSFISLILSYTTPFRIMAVSIGQFMLIRRETYQEIGGYAAIRDQTADDLALVRLVKSYKRRWGLFDGTLLIQCRMYRSFRQVVSGFSKNFFAGFGYRIIPYLFIWIWMAIVFLEPPIIVLINLVNIPIEGYSIQLALLAILEASLLFGLTLFRFRFPLWIVLFYPISILLSVVIALRSLFITLTGRASWKGRTIDRPQISWF